MSRILVVGSSNLDFTVRTEHLPAKGETIIGTDMRSSFGGKGANQAVAASRLGGDVFFITKLGNDSNGQIMSEHFREEKLNPDGFIIDPSVPSGTAWICVDEGGDNLIVVQPGANSKLTAEDLRKFETEIRKADYVLMQLEIPMEVIAYVTGVARAHGVKVVLNPAPACKVPGDILSKVDYLVPNEKECCLLCGSETTGDAIRDAEQLRSKGVGAVIVTLGCKGSVYVGSEGIKTVAARKVDAVDTVAAGDTYCGALCVALSEGRSIEDAMKFASHASAIAVTRKGAQSSIPFRNELED